MTEETHEKLKAIKQSFRSMMNGPVSQSMREKGSDYKINWVARSGGCVDGTDPYAGNG